MTAAFTESVVEDAALDWLSGLGWAIKHGPEIARRERPSVAAGRILNLALRP